MEIAEYAGQLVSKVLPFDNQQQVLFHRADELPSAKPDNASDHETTDYLTSQPGNILFSSLVSSGGPENCV